jgi:hypothetical protein
VPSFGVSISVLALAQAAVVGLPRSRPVPIVQRLRGRAWAVMPAASVIAVVFGVRAAAGAAEGLTYLALVAVPALAALGLAWGVRGARPRLVILAPALFLLAWADRSGLAGEAAALALSAVSCAMLGVLLAAVAPSRWLKAGIVLMALVDTTLVVADLLQGPNDTLNAAAPAAGLPQLQKAVFGGAVMGYGDLFVAGLLGGVLAASWPIQRRAAVLAAALALIFDLLFLVVNELPATLPIAVTLVIVEVAARRQPRGSAALGRPVPVPGGPG